LNNKQTTRYLSHKQATMHTRQANQTEHYEIILPILKKKSEINWDFGQL